MIALKASRVACCKRNVVLRYILVVLSLVRSLITYIFCSVPYRAVFQSILFQQMHQIVKTVYSQYTHRNDFIGCIMS
jgi:hypothetical protein